jgi:8-oxo-dGTP diphosphatase
MSSPGPQQRPELLRGSQIALPNVQDVLGDKYSDMTGNETKIRKGTSAILISTDGHLLLQVRDNLPHVIDPGKISLFGGSCEENESFLDCVVREVHEEIGCYLQPERFELIGSYFGPDYSAPDRLLRGEIFLARDVPLEELTISEGTLKIVALDELRRIYDYLAPPARYAFEIFLNRDRLAKRQRDLF